MKKFDLVRIINEEPYLKNNLKKDMYGVIINIIENTLEVLFFNPQNMGDYAIICVRAKDVECQSEKLPIEIQKELTLNMDKIINKKEDILKPIKFNEYDLVELLVEDKKYSKFGIHKGEQGCVMSNRAVENYIEVDFSGIDENGEYYGDCISVKIEDLKKIK